MITFLKSIKNLTQLIQRDNSLNPFSFDLIKLANISADELVLIKNEVENIELIHCDEFWELTEEIYKCLMLRTTTIPVMDFFRNILSENFKQNYLDTEGEFSMNFEITYSFDPWESFILKWHKQDVKDPTSVSVSIQTTYAESQIQKLLDLFAIKDQTWIDSLYDFDYAFNFESDIESLFRGIVFECWKSVKLKSFNCYGTLREEIGGSFTYDLNSRQTINKF